MMDYKERNKQIKRILTGVFPSDKVSVRAWRGMMVGHAVTVRIFDDTKSDVRSLTDFVRKLLVDTDFDLDGIHIQIDWPPEETGPNK
jgi:hypothetical protein